MPLLETVDFTLLLGKELLGESVGADYRVGVNISEIACGGRCLSVGARGSCGGGFGSFFSRLRASCH